MSAHKTFGQIFIANSNRKGLQNVPCRLSIFEFVQPNLHLVAYQTFRPFRTPAAKQEKKPTNIEKTPNCQRP